MRIPIKLTYISCLLLPLSVEAYLDRDINSLSLHELLKIKTTTASKRAQSLQETPALVEIITQNDLQRRGYKDLSYLLDDLTGIQVSRTFGDNYFNTLWRGVRHTIGSSHLILIDGIEFNHLYNNEAEVLAAFPMSNIKHIEVVYGPASVAYGNDAVVGIINIITDKEKNSSNGFVQFGEQDTRVLDINWFKQFDDYTLSITARYDDGDLDFSKANSYRWTQSELLTNRDIWGGFADEFGDLSSPHKNRGFDARLFNQNHEIALQFYRLAGGYGLEYTFDHSLPDVGLWIENDLSFLWRWQNQLSENLHIKTLMRYRESDIDDNSFFIESYLTTNANTGAAERLVDASYWESENDSVTASVEMNWQMDMNWNFLGGLEFESKDLQKAYNINFGPSLPPQQIDLQTYQFPQPPSFDTVANNRIETEQHSFYGLAEYQLPTKDPDSDSQHHLHFGVRNDRHSEYDNETSIRTGYVGQWSRVTTKLFYGEAFQEPSPRLLYGGWQGSGSDPNLNPRTAATWEFNINYQFDDLLLSANIFRMTSKNLFNTTDDGAINAGKGKSTGGDLRLQYRPDTQVLQDFSLWASYSWLDAREQSFNDNNQLVWLDSGDLASQTVHFGSYLTINPRWQLNLRGRYYGNRTPIETNPLDKIESFTSVDLNLTYSPDTLSHLKFTLEVTNLFDETYFHPGVRSASASPTNTGSVNANGVWIGSESFYNAQIVQPGREARLTLYYQF